MSLRSPGRLGCILLAVLLSVLAQALGVAGGEPGSAVDFAKTFLEKYPRFRAEGVMTSTLAAKPPYHCRVEMVFDKTNAVLFSYNTDGAKNIIPYDYAYADHELHEKIYDRDRTHVLKNTEIGAPTRTVFNFVWNILYEAEHGAGINSLVANGLMSIEREDNGKGTKILLRRRIPTGPIEKVAFAFDDDDRLKTIEIVQGDGSIHRIEIKRFRPDPKPQATAPGDAPRKD